MSGGTFETSDIGLSAYLAALGYPRIGKRMNGNRVMFMFSIANGRDLASDVANFTMGTDDEVSASKFQREAMNLRDELKNRR